MLPSRPFSNGIANGVIEVVVIGGLSRISLELAAQQE